MVWGHNEGRGCQIYTLENIEKNLVKKRSAQTAEPRAKAQIVQIKKFDQTIVPWRKVWQQ